MNDVVSLINELRSEEREYLNNYLANAPKWLLEAFQIVRLKKGTTFIHENAHVDTVYILVEGIVKATDYRIQEVAYDYTRFYPIEVFGAMEFLMGYDLYKTTLMTETDCRFLCVSKDQFSRWMLTDIHAVLEQVKAMSVYLVEQVRKERLFLFLQGIDRLFLLFMQIYRDSARRGGLPDSFDEKGFVQQHGAVCEDGKPMRKPDGGRGIHFPGGKGNLNQ